MSVTRNQAIAALAGTALGEEIARLKAIPNRNEFEESRLNGMLSEAERYIARQMA